MLVCSVSLLRRRAAIAAELAESAAALDAPGTGNVVFATLVDDPASVGETVDAYLGEIMLEAASAASTVTGNVVYNAAVVEEAAASHTSSSFGTFTYTVAVIEPALAADLVDAFLSVIYNVNVTETATAADSPSALVPLSGLLTETAVADDSPSVLAVYGVAVSETVAADATQAASLTVIVGRSAMVAGAEPVFVNPGSPPSSLLQSGTVVVTVAVTVSDATAAEAAAATSSETAAVNTIP